MTSWRFVRPHLLGDRDAFTKNYYRTRAGRRRLVEGPDQLGRRRRFRQQLGRRAIAADDAAWYGRDSFVPRMIAVPEMRAAYLGRFATSLRTAFLPVILKNRVTRVAEVIRPVAIRDLLQWDRGMDFQAELDRLMGAIELRWQTMNGVVSFQQR